MTRTSRTGFTLIEMLVTVLIIGILVSVALPQYKRAVMKSRIADLMSVLSVVERAQQATYVASGSYAWNWNELDTDVSSVFRKSRWTYYYKDFAVTTTGIEDANNNPVFSYEITFPAPLQTVVRVALVGSGERVGMCFDKKGEDICKYFTPRKECPAFVPDIEGWQGGSSARWCF